jgi:hypothetical protein
MVRRLSYDSSVCIALTRVQVVFQAAQVYVESEWYDGPVRGVADLGNQPHYFERLWDERSDDYAEVFALWLISPENLKLEIEAWRLFVKWNEQYEDGTVSVESHPGQGGIDERYDELQEILTPARRMPALYASFGLELVRVEERRRYINSGPNYRIRWIPVE